jgi:two-component system, cell cycle response regulator DivK
MSAPVQESLGTPDGGAAGIAGADDGQRSRVLIIDDHRLNIELARAVLEAGGFEVSAAESAEEAWVRLSECRPDLVLMDIQLPGEDGLALTRRIKADPAWQHLVVVAFTAYAMRGDEARMREGGCDGYLAKPIDVKTFAAQVRALLQAAQG